MATIRAFIAIEVPDEVNRTLTDASRKLGATIPSGAVRWVKPEAMHLTLRFLGDTDEKLVPDIGRALDEAGRQSPTTYLRLGSLGAFPNIKRPRVIWIALQSEPGVAAGLLTLKTRLDHALEPLGWPPEAKPFTPHLTLGRVREGRSVQGLPWQMAVPEIAFPVTAIHLIESELRPEGPRYTVRHTARLSEQS